jgi:hypothetical protein
LRRWVGQSPSDYRRRRAVHFKSAAAKKSEQPRKWLEAGSFAGASTRVIDRNQRCGYMTGAVPFCEAICKIADSGSCRSTGRPAPSRHGLTCLHAGFENTVAAAERARCGQNSEPPTRRGYRQPDRQPIWLARSRRRPRLPTPGACE